MAILHQDDEIFTSLKDVKTHNDDDDAQIVAKQLLFTNRKLMIAILIHPVSLFHSRVYGATGSKLRAHVFFRSLFKESATSGLLNVKRALFYASQWSKLTQQVDVLRHRLYVFDCFFLVVLNSDFFWQTKLFEKNKESFPFPFLLFIQFKLQIQTNIEKRSGHSLKCTC